jgi:hypothetical protein
LLTLICFYVFLLFFNCSGRQDPCLVEMQANATGLFDFPGAGLGQLPFKRGDQLLINTAEIVGEGWLSAKLAHLPSIGGIVPANYVKVEAQQRASPPAPPPAPQVQMNTREAVGLYDFASGPPGHLPFSKGDVLQVYLEDPAGDWLKAMLGNNTGLIPANYIKFTAAQQPSLFADPPAASAAAPAPAEQQSLFADPAERSRHSEENEEEGTGAPAGAAALSHISAEDKEWLDGNDVGTSVDFTKLRVSASEKKKTMQVGRTTKFTPGMGGTEFLTGKIEAPGR